MARRNSNTARERARAAKRSLDADRAARDAAMIAAATEVYEAADRIEEGQRQYDAALLRLVDVLKVPTAEIAVLVDRSKSEVAASIKQARDRSAEPDESADPTEATGDGPE